MMAYCTSAQLRDLLKEEVIDSILGNVYIEDPAERERQLAPLMEAAIADAQGEIDGYLAKGHSTPLQTVPKVIEKFAKDIAVYNLLSRSGLDEGGHEANYLARYKAAIKFLTLVAEGKVSLGLESGSGSGSQVAGAVSLVAPPRRFRRESLEGM